MTETKFTIDSIAKAVTILTTYGSPIAEPKSIGNVKVGNVSYINGQTGLPFTWENSGQPYAIVNLRLIAQDKMATALEILQDEMFASVETEETIEDEELLDALRDACNNNLSFNADIETAKQLEAVGRANVHIDEVQLSTEDGEPEMYGLRVVGCKPVVLEKQKRTSTNSLLALLHRAEVTEKTGD